MMKLLEYDESIPNMKGALLQIFGNTLIPQNLSVGHEYATRDSYQCVTLNGDIVTSRGAMDGGYNDNKYKRLRCYGLIREMRERYDEIMDGTKETESKLKSIESKLLEIDNKIRRCDQESDKYRSDLQENKEKMVEIEEEIEIEEASKNKQLLILEKHEANIERINVSIRKLESEMKAPLKNRLSDEEEAKMKEIADTNESIRQNLAKIVVEISEVEMKRNEFESSLKDNLFAQSKDLV